jgi:hypothetical protein
LNPEILSCFASNLTPVRERCVLNIHIILMFYLWSGNHKFYIQGSRLLRLQSSRITPYNSYLHYKLRKFTSTREVSPNGRGEPKRSRGYLKTPSARKSFRSVQCIKLFIRPSTFNKIHSFSDYNKISISCNNK